jgi:hypothetical protein
MHNLPAAMRTHIHSQSIPTHIGIKESSQVCQRLCVESYQVVRLWCSSCNVCMSIAMLHICCSVHVSVAVLLYVAFFARLLQCSYMLHSPHVFCSALICRILRTSVAVLLHVAVFACLLRCFYVIQFPVAVFACLLQSIPAPLCELRHVDCTNTHMASALRIHVVMCADDGTRMLKSTQVVAEQSGTPSALKSKPVSPIFDVPELLATDTCVLPPNSGEDPLKTDKLEVICSCIRMTIRMCIS